MGLVALLSAGLGFVARGLLGQARPPPAQAAETVAPAPPQVARAAESAPAEQARPEVDPSRAVVAVPAAADAVAPEAPAPTPTPHAPEPSPGPSPKAAEPPARKRITVAYKAFEGEAQRIIIPVRLNGGVTANMALDTGAPGTILFAPLARRLGLLEEGSNRLLTMVGGLGGRAPALLVVLDSLAVDDARSEFVPATVTASLTDAFEGLVGMDFLAGYSVNIDTPQHQLVLTELPPSNLRPGGHDERWWRRTFAQFEDQLALWNRIHAALKERAFRNPTSGDGSAELLAFAERQVREAEQLATRFERHASYKAVPREWRWR